MTLDRKLDLRTECEKQKYKNISFFLLISLKGNWLFKTKIMLYSMVFYYWCRKQTIRIAKRIGRVNGISLLEDSSILYKIVKY